jgi:Ras GTPase-activating-like protein IQGAP2/3
MSYVDQPASPGVSSSRRLTNRNTNRYSVTALFSMAAEQDVEVEDDLARGPFFLSINHQNAHL